MKSIRSRSSASGAQANFSSLASSASLFPAGNVKPGYRTVLGYFSRYVSLNPALLNIIEQSQWMTAPLWSHKSFVSACQSKWEGSLKSPPMIIGRPCWMSDCTSWIKARMVSSRKDCLFAFKTSSSSVIGLSIFFQVVPLYPRGI